MKKTSLAIFILISSLAFGQVKFTQIPMDSQLVATRYSLLNLGTIDFQGYVFFRQFNG